MSAKPDQQNVNSGRATGTARFNNDSILSPVEFDIEQPEAWERNAGVRYVADLCETGRRPARLTRCPYDNLSGSQTVQLARHPYRPTFSDYVDLIVKDFCELHGDRSFGDDRALVTGFGLIAGRRVLLVGHNKGRKTAERISRRFGYAHPEGYRKALQKMKLAEKFGLPVVSWIDTPGAFPGIEAEERGIAQAIAVNLREMSRLRVPVVSVVLSEGGSGGALGIGVADRLAMFKHAYFSVITPEGCAAILFPSSGQTKRAADALHLRAADLKRLHLIDDILDEPLGGAHRNPRQAAASLECYLGRTLAALKAIPIDTLVEQRQARLRALGNGF